jgi:TonB family protein
VAAGHPRRIVKTIRPEYPVVLKNKGIGGVVRLNVRVLANGNVASVSVIGGNPILADSAAKSIMTWQFESATSASNEVITFDFNAH